MVINRRDWLQGACLSAFGLSGRGLTLLHGQGMPAHSSASPLHLSPQDQVLADAPRAQTLASYVDPLPVPPLLRLPKGGEAVGVVMREFRHKAHRDLPPTTMWGYNGMWPGPTFELRRGQSISVNWINELPTNISCPSTTPSTGRKNPCPRHELSCTSTARRSCRKMTAIRRHGPPLTARPGRRGRRMRATIPTTSRRPRSGITITPSASPG